MSDAVDQETRAPHEAGDWLPRLPELDWYEVARERHEQAARALSGARARAAAIEAKYTEADKQRRQKIAAALSAGREPPRPVAHDEMVRAEARKLAQRNVRDSEATLAEAASHALDECRRHRADLQEHEAAFPTSLLVAIAAGAGGFVEVRRRQLARQIEALQGGIERLDSPAPNEIREVTTHDR